VSLSTLGAVEVRALLGHVARWLANLRRAGDARKRESVAALRDVIVAVRRTSAYLRTRGDAPSLEVEQALSETWTRLGFRLRDLGVEALAKRCDVSGRHWADPASLDADFLEKADVSLASIERLALLLLQEHDPRR
jgi:hypothetical protein